MPEGCPVSSRVWRHVQGADQDRLPGACARRCPRREGRGHRPVPAREGGAADRGPAASSPSRRRTARSACSARAAAPTGASTSRATRRRRRPAGPAASSARSARSTASTSTTRSACTAASASRSARSTRCSGARSTSTPSLASPTCSTTKTASASGWRPSPKLEPYEAGSDSQGAAKKCRRSDGRPEHLLRHHRGRDGLRRRSASSPRNNVVHAAL